MSPEISVRLKNNVDRSYKIVIRPGAIQSLPRFISDRWNGKKAFIITDSNLLRRYGRTLQTSFTRNGIESVLLSFPAGEASKNEKTVSRLHTELLGNGIRRDSVIIALGGGVVGDIAGYVAATVLRGVPFVQVPTSLLAQVDSSVGGKVGIDHRAGKNLIGAFHQPSAVIIDPQVLRTLPEKEFRNGLAEVVKIAAGMDKSFFFMLERSSASIAKANTQLLTKIIIRAVELKRQVVEKDEFEKHLRKTLNLGHTIGHALEAASGYSVQHGQAVSIGLVAESNLAMQIGILEERDYKRVVNVLRRLKLPTAFPSVQRKSKFFRALNADKKSENNRPQFVLLKGIGRTEIGVSIPPDLVRSYITKKV